MISARIHACNLRSGLTERTLTKAARPHEVVRVKNFALTGAGGYVAPRHLRAIRDTGNRLVAALDPNDSVGILDQFGFDTRFFTETERFDRFFEESRRGPESERIDFLTVCSPNYLHDAHCRMGLRTGADVICEKPLVINPWDLDQLEQTEQETGHRISCVLQLRVHDKLLALRDELLARASDKKHEIDLTYVTARGDWYFRSWKGAAERSGGVPTNIGIHLFDVLVWLFGKVQASEVHLCDVRRAAGYLDLERARVRWYLSVAPEDLPFAVEPGRRTTFREISVDGTAVDLSDGFADLHTRIYENVLRGEGFGIATVRPAIELAYRIRTAPVVRPREATHPYAAGKVGT
jgi:UDP-N-acetyl-2-amino-2-deoxyglucuronate dehydrogenase